MGGEGGRVMADTGFRKRGEGVWVRGEIKTAAAKLLQLLTAMCSFTCESWLLNKEAAASKF